jgi:hypothetical protein
VPAADGMQRGYGSVYYDVRLRLVEAAENLRAMYAKAAASDERRQLELEYSTGRACKDVGRTRRGGGHGRNRHVGWHGWLARCQ